MKNKKPTIGIFLLTFFPYAAISCIVCGLIYVSVQQDLRQSANDPQIQIAEDAAQQLAGGQPVFSVIPEQKIDISQSLDTFVMVFNQNGTLIGTSALLNHEPPVFPVSVLMHARNQGQERLTWQPDAGVRSAVVVMPYSGSQAGFVVSGRSLREVEIRENNLETEVVIGWLLILLVSSVPVFTTLGFRMPGKKQIKRKRN